MPKIRTLVESLKEGQEKAFKGLDEQVESLGDICIKNIQDSFYSIGNHPSESEYYVKRIVIYNDANLPMKGEPWKPNNLDMDLKKFSAYLDLPKEPNSLLMDSYLHGEKKTIREFLAAPRIWFEQVGFIVNYKKRGGKGFEKRKGKDNWEHLKIEFAKYGLQLLKKGNVIKD